jgi:para-aminobenzoate synthetase component 1
MTPETAIRNDKGILCRVHHKKICEAIDLPAVSEVFADLKLPSILGGNPARRDAGRFSYWAAQPRDVFEFRSGEKDPFGKLQQALDKYKIEEDSCRQVPEGVFCGGWIGYFGYELGRYIERLPETATDDLETPLIRLCFYDRFICYDHAEDVFGLIALQFPDDTETPQEKLASLENLLTQAGRITVPPPPAADLDNIDFASMRCNMDRDCYTRAIERIKRYIYDGDVYQINFSQRFECDYHAAPVQLFHWQNHYNPSGYAAFIDAGNFQIVSASPEMFITVEDDVISTKPIKGTRRRLDETGPNAAQAERINSQNFNDLVRSEKEQAELNMIIDLERNDLVRICRYGTRRVVQPRTIEAYPTVFHAVATVAGRLRDNISFCDIIKAMFPGGSITGAPKIRSMEIIDETEPTARGVYTGSIGCIGLDGTASLNIAIRTIIIKNKKAFAQTGGGIVADSDPNAEWDETITKARALLAGIKAVNRNSLPVPGEKHGLA